jgi:hypothetical protein
MDDGSIMKTKFVFAMLVSMHVRLFAGSDGQTDFIAHEWGTFTSVQGADGVQLEWNPVIKNELPKFVYDRARPGDAAQDPPFLGKSVLATLQRMETPVIYFYSGEERKVDVTVKFPQGTVTEWYPQLGKYNPKLIRWDQVQLFPGKNNASLASTLPTDLSGNHYFAARETDADFLSVNNAAKKAVEHEKFLFYRGVGQFTAPLQVTLGGNEDTVIMKNNGTEPLTRLYVLYLSHGSGKYLYVDRLAPGGEQTVKLELQSGQSPLSDLRPRLAKDMAGSLAREGLFEREASAMVKTWNDSWFGEEGLRVLYTLPGAWTDRTLPLTISPAPSGLVRVMVGRAEMITPMMEWKLMKEVARYSDTDPITRQQAIANVQALGLGRFTEPAIRRLIGKMPNREFGQTAWNLLRDSTPKPAEQKLALVK